MCSVSEITIFTTCFVDFVCFVLREFTSDPSCSGLGKGVGFRV